MYRCQFCDSVVPPGTPAARVVLETRPALYLTVRSGGRTRSRRLDPATTEIEVWINQDKGTIRRPARLDELRDGLGTADGFFQLVDGSEIAREATACPACAAHHAVCRPTNPAPEPVPCLLQSRVRKRPKSAALLTLTRPGDRLPQRHAELAPV